MKHVMLDLETFGVKPGVIIRSIGAVEFELDGRTGKSIYANVDRKSSRPSALFPILGPNSGGVSNRKPRRKRCWWTRSR